MPFLGFLLSVRLNYSAAALTEMDSLAAVDCLMGK